MGLANTIDHLVEIGARDAPALIVHGSILSHGALAHRVAAAAGWLAAQGFAPGDRVATWLPKVVEAAVMPLATARAGLVHVPVNPLLKGSQVAHILADSGAALLLTQAAREALLPDGVAARIATIEDVSEALVAAPPLPPSNRSADELAALLYTSGSTGRPKGVMLSHRNLWLGAESVATYLGLGADDRVLAVLPLSFDYGQSQLLATLKAGGCTVLLDYLTPRDVVKAVVRHDITTLAGVPPLWLQLVEADWPAEARAPLRRLTNSGGRLPMTVVRRLRETFPGADLVLMYGLTEAFRSTFLDPALVDARPTSIGKAIPYAEVLVVRPDGRETAADEPGELVHCGPLVAGGYWRDKERTVERFRPAPSGSRHGGIAVWSGDTVVRDADGYLSFIGRDDEMIKTSGNRVSPTEVEEAVLATGAVAECAAFGIPDPRLGEAIRLIARPGDGLDAGAAQDMLDKGLRRMVPGYMVPAVVEWRDALPRNANGKLDRARLKGEGVL